VDIGHIEGFARLVIDTFDDVNTLDDSETFLVLDNILDVVGGDRGERIGNEESVGKHGYIGLIVSLVWFGALIL